MEAMDIRENYGLYVRKDSFLRNLDARPLKETIPKAVGYVFKSLLRGWCDSDDLIVLPRSRSEVGVSSEQGVRSSL
jgi:hypothetical protein